MPIEVKTLPVLYEIDSPATAVRYQGFEVKVTVEREITPTAVNELSVVTLEVESRQGFFMAGPTKKNIVVFSGQKSVIPINFIPLIAGSTTLPMITLTHNGHGWSTDPQQFSIPIVITYVT
jgi:hypothetical protein